MPNINNSEDILDSLDIVARIEELEEERDALQEAVDESQKAYTDFLESLNDEADAGDTEEGRDLADTLAGERKALAEWEAGDNPEELAKLKAFAADLEGYGDWDYGETLIRESYFTEYCEEMLKDSGELPSKIPFYVVIDWEATAENLKGDYTESEFDGVTYYMRA